MPERAYQRCDSRFRDILIRHAYDFKQERRERGASEKTVANELAAVERFIAFLCDEPR